MVAVASRQAERAGARQVSALDFGVALRLVANASAIVRFPYMWRTVDCTIPTIQWWLLFR